MSISVKQIREELAAELEKEMKLRGYDTIVCGCYRKRLQSDIRRIFNNKYNNYAIYEVCNRNVLISLFLDVYEKTIDI